MIASYGWVHLISLQHPGSAFAEQEVGSGISAPARAGPLLVATIPRGGRVSSSLWGGMAVDYFSGRW